MRMNKQIVVTDWIKEKPKLGSFLKLTLSSDERRILRGKRLTDCDQEIILQLPRDGKLNDGDILSTNESNFYVEIIAKTENLIEISSNSKIELIKTAYHLGNRHVEVEIEESILLTKSDYVIKNMLLNFKVDLKNTKKKFFPERGAHSHE
ncbi:urease accessory protein UreE [Prochlorococcus marinus str. MU1404]|uniref:urease accessory protein UreE n=1 Tax=Prochlorococcus marinus TaxID=1219 RepID=UPI001ADCDBDC|nr:urease accessory protein UreE [Prochlorococcus marinus]MBO8230132.1 urease accessory protein UreE [Prochlorococcus marinus XMU1404]MBW3073094.1 urease accessory protein UreE [Prochlorococcus marinus str. MU1404]MCR8545531.1 urease accessory protein UreE [Prochlorococcus marinus CUG1432]